MTDIERSYVAPGSAGKLALLTLGLFLVGTNAFVIAGLLPEIAASLRVPPEAVGFSVTWYALIVGICSPAVSILLARVDRGRLMAAGLLLIAVGTLTSATAPSLGVFIAGRSLAALGGAALVPTATAAAPALLPPDQRGRALAIAALGFTLANAVGAPAGTALAGLAGWRAPLLVIAALALVLAVLTVVLVRGIPNAVAATMGQRLVVLRDRRIVLALLATVVLTMGFNVVYLFSAAVARGATGGSSSALAVLLLLFGVGGVIGTLLTGRLTDRLGSRAVATIALVVEAAALLLLVPLARSFVGLAVAFLVWGITAFAAVVPVQDVLVSSSRGEAGIALSWYSTAMYAGIALAPVLGAAAIVGGGTVVVVAGALAAMVAAVVLQGAVVGRTVAPAA